MQQFDNRFRGGRRSIGVAFLTLPSLSDMSSSLEEVLRDIDKDNDIGPGPAKRAKVNKTELFEVDTEWERWADAIARRVEKGKRPTRKLTKPSV